MAAQIFALSIIKYFYCIWSDLVLILIIIVFIFFILELLGRDSYDDLYFFIMIITSIVCKDFCST